ncbi:hypothetical protein [Acidicapsa ligni]|uniref:hypothetical protein n=1 Tax=Acidicapsa ligni TaxID=542300 RepID=UPI0021E0B3AE|nr:hypothetical protein [Acidicapsa ligni]
MVKARSTHRRTANLRPLALLVICLIGLAGSGAALAQQPSSCADVQPTATLTVQGLEFRSYKTEDKACLKVFRNRVLIYHNEEEGGTLTFGSNEDAASSPGGVAPGTDVIGRGHANVLALYYSGGAHCCTQLLIFELDPTLTLLTRVNLGNDDGPQFKRDSTNKHYLMATIDNTFGYWHTYFAASPLTPILLEPLDDGKGGIRFALAVKAMRKPDPTQAEWNANDLKSAREAFLRENIFDNYYVGSDLWRSMLLRIYAGQDAWAWKTVDAAWPARKPGKDAFLKDFCGQLSQSPYWADLRPTIKNSPPACAETFAQPHKKTPAK